MVDKPTSGRLFGVPYNFERPSMKRMLESYWKPGEEMLVEKPFGVGYTLNLANWRSWIVIAIAAVLLWRERSTETASDEDEGAVEVVVDD
ncbi:MAG: DUF5808 domain-containing protein [Halanaeroarchaeum sp.]